MARFDYVNAEIANIEKKHAEELFFPEFRQILSLVASRFAKHIQMRESALFGFIVEAVRETEAITQRTLLNVSKDPPAFAKWDELFVKILFDKLIAAVKGKNSEAEKEMEKQISQAKFLIRKAFIWKR